MNKKNKNYSTKVEKDNRITHLNKDALWIIEITLLAFFASLILSLFSDAVITNTTAIISVTVLLVFVALGILFDMIGVAVTVADKKVFHSMSAKKVHGSNRALKLIKNNSKVSSICNDVVGDICGILSGSAGVTIALALAEKFSINLMITNLVITSLIAAFTIGGKALGKSFAINKANKILFAFAKFIDFVTFSKK